MNGRHRDRQAPDLDDPVRPPRAAPDNALWCRRIVPDAVLPFRYSTLTFNCHRIHYDRGYVTGAENYPGLIVRGPMLASLGFRAVRPLFDTAPFVIAGTPDPAAEGATPRRKRRGFSRRASRGAVRFCLTATRSRSDVAADNVEP